MKQEHPYQWLLEKYPSTITKEQLYKVCHISKRTALHLLEHGIIPCKTTGKKTRKYSIATTDVITYLVSRDRHPECYLAPVGWYVGQHAASDDCSLTPESAQKMRQYYMQALTEYPDVLTISDITNFTGYVSTTVVNWCNKQAVQHFTIKGKYLIPKPWLMDFLLDTRFRTIKVKSQKHRAHIAALAKW